MRDFFKRIKADFMFSSILCIVLGIVFIVWKSSVVDVLGTVLSVGLLVIGLIYLCGFFTHIMDNVVSIIVGIVFAAIGIWFLIDPSRILSLIPIIIGIGLLFQGIRGIAESMTAKKYGYKNWGVNFVLSVVNVVCGILCVIFASTIIEAAAIAVGIILIYNGVSNIWIICCASSAQKRYEKNASIIDVEVIEEKK